MHQSPSNDASTLLVSKHLKDEMKISLEICENNYKKLKELEKTTWDKASKFFSNSWSACHEQLKQFFQKFQNDGIVARGTQSHENFKRAKEILDAGLSKRKFRDHLAYVCKERISLLGELKNVKESLEKLIAISATRKQTEVSTRKVTATSRGTSRSSNGRWRCSSEASSSTDGTSSSGREARDGSVSQATSPGDLAEISRVLDVGWEELCKLKSVRGGMVRFFIESWKTCRSHLQKFTKTFQENDDLIRKAKYLQRDWLDLKTKANIEIYIHQPSEPHADLKALIQRCQNIMDEAKQLQIRHERIRDFLGILNRIVGNTTLDEMAACLIGILTPLASWDPTTRESSTAGVQPATGGHPSTTARRQISIAARRHSSTAARSNSSTAARRHSSTTARDNSSTPARGNSSTPARGNSSTAARGNSSTPARGNSSTAARGNSSTAARGNSSTAARGYSSTAARGDSSTAARGSSSTAARGNSSTAARGNSSTAAKGNSSTAARGDSSTAARGYSSTAARVQESSPSRTSGTKRPASAFAVRDAGTTTAFQSSGYQKPWDADLRRFTHPRAQGDEATAAKRRR